MSFLGSLQKFMNGGLGHRPDNEARSHEIVCLVPRSAVSYASNQINADIASLRGGVRKSMPYAMLTPSRLDAAARMVFERL